MKKLLLAGELPIIADMRPYIYIQTRQYIVSVLVRDASVMIDDIIREYRELGRFNTRDNVQRLADKYIERLVDIYMAPIYILEKLFNAPLQRWCYAHDGGWLRDCNDRIDRTVDYFYKVVRSYPYVYLHFCDDQLIGIIMPGNELPRV